MIPIASIHQHLPELKEHFSKCLREGLDKKNRWNYLYPTETLSEADLIKIFNQFIELHLDDFLAQSMLHLPTLNKNDIESIGTDSLTPTAQSLFHLVSFLEKKGFPGPSAYKKPLNFWSGQEARLKATSSAQELSDNKIPLISVMFALCRAIQNTQGTYTPFTGLFASAISRIYCSFATEEAQVYISSDKISEAPGFTVPNNFWEGELATLQALKRQGKINDIKINRYNTQSQTWEPPVSLFSKAGFNIPLYRRSAHPSENHDFIDRFKPLKKMTMEEKMYWEQSKPRPSITYGKLVGIVKHWQAKTTHLYFKPAVVEHFIEPLHEKDMAAFKQSSADRGAPVILKEEDSWQPY